MRIIKGLSIIGCVLLFGLITSWLVNLSPSRGVAVVINMESVSDKLFYTELARDVSISREYVIEDPSFSDLQVVYKLEDVNAWIAKIILIEYRHDVLKDTDKRIIRIALDKSETYEINEFNAKQQLHQIFREELKKGGKL